MVVSYYILNPIQLNYIFQLELPQLSQNILFVVAVVSLSCVVFSDIVSVSVGVSYYSVFTLYISLLYTYKCFIAFRYFVYYYSLDYGLLTQVLGYHLLRLFVSMLCICMSEFIGS